MKHDELRSIGHNLADSLASGVGFLIGMYATDVFGEARKNPAGFLIVDFLNGTIQGRASASLAKAVSLYRDTLPLLCEKHGASVSYFRELAARYSVDAIGPRVLVTVEDQNGRRSTDEYVGAPLRHVKITDSLGRIRTQRN